MSDDEQTWGEKRPMLWTVIMSLTAGGFVALIWWRHADALRVESLAMLVAAAALPILNTKRTLRRVASLTPEHHACGRDLVNAALTTAVMVLITVVAVLALLFDCLRA